MYAQIDIDVENVWFHKFFIDLKIELIPMLYF